MLGTYSADPTPRSTEVISDDFPFGLAARGEYKVISKVIDLDGVVWLGASILLIARMPNQNNRSWSRLGMAVEDCERLVRITSEYLVIICGCVVWSV